MLICHGNAGNISHRLELCGTLLATGASVFVFDYRGYGRSQGRPGEEGAYYRDAQAHQWLQHRGFTGERIIAFGESLGEGVASELALRERSGGLVLQSTFTSIPDVAAELFPWLPARWLCTIRYDTLAKLPRLRLPLLVMHGRADTLIGFHHGEKNFAAANPPKLFWRTLRRPLRPAARSPAVHPRRRRNSLGWSNRIRFDIGRFPGNMNLHFRFQRHETNASLQ